MNYTKQLQLALETAKRISKKLEHNYIGTEHLLVGLVRQKDSLAGKILAAEGVNEEHIMQLISELIAPGNDVAVMERDGNTPKMDAVLALTEEEAEAAGATDAGTEHALMAILRTGDCAAARLLSSMDRNLQKIFNDVVAAMGADGETYRQEMTRRSRAGYGGSERSALKQYSRNLTELAANGELDPIIGREEEITRVVQTLSRRGKNNPCLIGEPGVGKTAIVEGLAQRIYAGAVPDSVLNITALCLSM